MYKPERGLNRKRILAVDDAVIILRRITNALEEYYDVVTVSSGTRALKYLEKEKPDLILRWTLCRIYGSHLSKERLSGNVQNMAWNT